MSEAGYFDELKQEKARIRAEILSLRNALPPGEPEKSSATISEKLLALPAYINSRVVMSYCGFGAELDTMGFNRAALESGKTLVLPKINRAQGRLEIYSVKDLAADLRPGVWGILEPDPAACAPAAHKGLEFVLTPGLAFDRDGGRLGYGRGYYDKLLHACAQAGGKPTTVAACMEMQVVEEVPMGPNDVPVQQLVTEKHHYFCR